MNRDQIVEKLMAERPKDFKSRAAADRIVKGVFEEITSCLAAGEAVEIYGFGSFRSVERGERMGHNPRGGEKMLIPAHKAPVFHASSALKRKIQ